MTTAEKLKAEGRAEGIEEGIEKGIEKGRAEGIEKGIRMTALNLLKSGVSVAVIVKATGFSEREIEKIATENRP